jgi:hypothetical protein
VDSASLAAANQFREGRTVAQIDASSDEFVNLNSLNPASADVFICDFSSAASPYHDASLCPCDDDHPNPDYHCPCTLDPPSDCVDSGVAPRKYVKVEGTLPVDFSFLPIVGWGSIDITAEAISETASVDVVLAIDTSASMAYDAPVGDPMRDPDICNPLNQCYPFEDVRTAALALVDRMYFPYDRMAIVTFDRYASIPAVLPQPPAASFVSDKTQIQNAINSLQVSPDPNPDTDPECTGWNDTPRDPRGCTSTNTAEGLKYAAAQFGYDPRQEAVWIVILLSDGSANAALDESSQWICPGGPDVPTWKRPYCRDEKFESEQGFYGFDAEDAAVLWGLVAGCPDESSMPDPPDPLITTCTDPGQGAVIFTIGLGNLVTDMPASGCDNPPYVGGCEPNQGEELLRYIAGIGDDGNPGTPPALDPCNGASIGENCGNYYYSPTGSGLLEVFEAIAARIFTRITH